MRAETEQRLYDGMKHEQGREAPPPGFPELPLIPGGRYTDPDHPALASQLYAAYARAAQARVLASVVGVEGLAETDRRYLDFGTAFEQSLASQTGARTLEQSMAIGWKLLAGLPRSELTRLSDAQIAAHIEVLK